MISMLSPDLISSFTWYQVISGGGSPRTSTSNLIGFPARTIVVFKFVRSILGFTKIMSILINYFRTLVGSTEFEDVKYSRALNLQICILEASEGGEGPALFTATTRNWYSPFSFKSGILAASSFPGTSIAFSQSGL